MPAIRPTFEYKYQHREFRQKLSIPYGRLIPPGFGPQFKPTRSIYCEQTDKPEDIRRILLQRRRVDGKTMLSDVRTIARGLDTSGVHTDEEIRDKLIPLLDHENLVRLMDIQFSQAKQINMAYLGFEHMSRGSLNRILFEKVAIPESLCWHVLEGVTNALLWLHYGYSKSRQEVDWNPIALISIHPGAIYFTAPRDDETYGIAKVSNFDNAIVMPKGQRAHDAIKIPNHTRDDLGYYVAPEVVHKEASAALVSDIYSLGAILYHMMLGYPPREVNLSHETTTHPAGRDAWVPALPPDTIYSPHLKRIVREMLRTSRCLRPDAATIYQNIITDMEVWRNESVEGRRYVRRWKEEEEEEEEEGEGEEGEEKVVDEDKEKGKGKKDGQGEGRVGEGKDGGAVLLEEGGVVEEEDGVVEEDEDDVMMMMDMRRRGERERRGGGGKTRGGAKTKGGRKTGGGNEQDEEEEEEEEEEREQGRGKGRGGEGRQGEDIKRGWRHTAIQE